MVLKNLSGMPALLLSLALTACTGASAYAPMAQSNFAYPNSNISPITHVKASVTRTYVSPFQIPDIPSAAMQREAYFKALQGSGGDLIIDGDFTVRTTLIPLLFVTIINAEGTVEGTAAKIDQVGMRKLK
jgi:hypothetical protein